MWGGGIGEKEECVGSVKVGEVRKVGDEREWVRKRKVSEVGELCKERWENLM